MATKIIKYTGDVEETITDGHGVNLVTVAPDDRLEEVGADLADWLVANKANYEYYNGTKTVTNDDFSVVNGRNIEPDSVTVDWQKLNPVDVTALSNPETGWVAYNDGTVGSEGPAYYDADGLWISIVTGLQID